MRVCFLLGVSLLLRAEEWPEFRGPSAQGHSSERGLAVEWSETKNLVWKTALPGRGWSSPSIAGGRIWLTTASGNGSSLRLLEVDQASGKLLRDQEVFTGVKPQKVHAKNNYAAPTPIVSGDRVYVHFGPLGTACVRTSGEVVWRTKLAYEYVPGPGGSPVLHKGLLIINCDGADQQYVVALDQETGKVRWRKSRDTYMAFSTPLIIQVNGSDQLISPSAHRTIAYDPANGKELWHVRYGDGFSNVSRPVFAHGLVFLSTGFNVPSFIAVRADGKGDVTSSHMAWSTNRGAPLTPSPIVVGDELYLVNDNGIASCLDARTGTPRWRERLGGTFSASPVFADHRLYFTSEDGDTTVIEPGKTFRKLASNSLDGRMLASMAVSGGAIFLRSETHLYRIEKAK